MYQELETDDIDVVVDALKSALGKSNGKQLTLTIQRTDAPYLNLVASVLCMQEEEPVTPAA